MYDGRFQHEMQQSLSNGDSRDSGGGPAISIHYPADGWGGSKVKHILFYDVVAEIRMEMFIVFTFRIRAKD